MINPIANFNQKMLLKLVLRDEAFETGFAPPRRLMDSIY